MCLLFVYIGKDEKSNEYRMVLAHNRDEYWDRPTQPLSYWEDHPACIGGRDLRSGKEGGTWLGISKNGRIGLLLSVLGVSDRRKKGRGHLVNGFITSDIDIEEYVNELSTTANEYQSYHLIIADLSQPKPKWVQCNNLDGDFTWKYLSDDIIVCDNSSGIMWQKTARNKKKFENIVKELNHPDQKDNLVNKLLTFLSDKTQFENDEQLISQATMTDLDDNATKERSAVFVWSPKHKCGTMSQSVILLEKDGQCEFLERTLITPVDENDVVWETNIKRFQLDLATKTK